MFGIASAAFVAAQVKLTRFATMLFIALRTPAKSFVPPILIAKVDGNALPEAFVF